MIPRKWSGALSAIFIGVIVFAIPSSSATASAAENRDGGWANTLQIPTNARQETTPIQQLDLYLTGFHVDPSRPAVQGAAHYYCQQLTAEFAQCPIYGDNGRDAQLIGVEYIISNRLFHTLTADEQRLWHPHVYEVQSGLLIAPGLAQEAEHKLMEHLASTYGKTWYLWQGKEQSLPVGHAPDAPVGRASVMHGPTKDGQLKPALVEERDRRFNVAVNELRQQRADIAPADTHSQKERRSARADMPVQLPEPPPPTLPAPRSDLPAPADPEPEPHANVPAQELPPSVQPAPVQPGLPSPPMPRPAEPGLAPPPMPQPAEPPPLSTRPDSNPPVPAVPEQEPAPPSSAPEPEPTAYKQAEQ
jgi:hypothetical protein